MDSKEDRAARKEKRRIIRAERDTRRAKRVQQQEPPQEPPQELHEPRKSHEPQEPQKPQKPQKPEDQLQPQAPEDGKQTGNDVAAERLKAMLQGGGRVAKLAFPEKVVLENSLGPSDLQEDARRERITSVDGDESLAYHIKKRARRYGEVGSDEDDVAAEAWADELNGNTSEKKKRKTEERRKTNERKAQMTAQRRNKQVTDAHENCRYCLANLHKFSAKHTVIAMGDHAYIALVHGLDEEVAGEIELFRKSLSDTFFASNQRESIFMESCFDFQRQRRHLIIECVAVRRKDASAAPSFFRQALLENGEEWSQNKKVIEVTADKGIGRSIPANFSYFYVQFGLSGGFCQLLEKDPALSAAAQFGHEVLSSLLDRSPPNGRNWARPGLHEELRRLKYFLPLFQPFDWTAQLGAE